MSRRFWRAGSLFLESFMRLRDYLDEDLVIVGLPDDDAATAIRALTDRLAEQGVVSDAAALGRTLSARSAAHTCLGHGVAVPHATIAELSRAVVALGVAPGGVSYEDPAIEPVRIFFVVLSPPERASTHIKLLARIARLSRHADVLERLQNAGSAAALLLEVERIDAQHA
jgi:mannitol/fructose-specific phosphotransferase system IIA component (Ntr-type)